MVGRVVPNWADIHIRADLGIEVTNERNAHMFPLGWPILESWISVDKSIGLGKSRISAE